MVFPEAERNHRELKGDSGIATNSGPNGGRAREHAMAAVAGVGGAAEDGEGENKDPLMMRQDSTLDIDPALAEAAASNSASRYER